MEHKPISIQASHKPWSSRTTLAARITSRGGGAVAAIAVWGEGSLAAIERFFTPAGGAPLAARPVGRINFGRFRAEAAAAGEEVVVCRRDEQEIEIHCHGGLAASEAILESLASAGCRLAGEADWIALHEQDPFARAAWLALAQATTERAAVVLLEQYRGALRRAWSEAIAALRAGDLRAAETSLEKLSRAGRIGRRLVEPWRVAIVGAPNAGKSTLLNALVGFERAIADATPGTTRDVVAARCAFDGWPVELADTAGLRETSDNVEAQGVERAIRQASAADLALIVRDAREALRGEDATAAIEAQEKLTVYNKVDLLTEAERRELLGRGDGILASALTGEGVAQIAAAFVARIAPETLVAGEAVPFIAEQLTAIDEALAAARGGDGERAATILSAWN